MNFCRKHCRWSPKAGTNMLGGFLVSCRWCSSSRHFWAFHFMWNVFVVNCGLWITRRIINSTTSCEDALLVTKTLTIFLCHWSSSFTTIKLKPLQLFFLRMMKFHTTAASFCNVNKLMMFHLLYRAVRWRNG